MMTKSATGRTPEHAEAVMLREIGLGAILQEDFKRHRNSLTSAGLWALWVHRVGVWGSGLPQPFRTVFWILHGVGHLLCRNLFGIEIERSVQIGRRMMIGHQHGIVVHKYARFGDDCLLRQGVTLGVGNGWQEGAGPVIGNNVSFGVGSVVVGNVTIGDNVQIGPNCVVMQDVPSDRRLFAPAPRVLPAQTAEPPATQAERIPVPAE